MYTKTLTHFIVIYNLTLILSKINNCYPNYYVYVFMGYQFYNMGFSTKATIVLALPKLKVPLKFVSVRFILIF